MRFISPKGQRFIALHDDWEILASGQPRIKKPGYTVEFKQGANAHDREVAKKSFHWTGTQMDQSGQPLDPVYDQDKVWVFDSGSIENPELRKQVEDALTSNPEFGREFILIEPEKVAAPYAKYDEHRKIQGRRTIDHAVADITAAYEAVGFDIDAAIAYEHANGGSDDVVAALNALRPAEAPQPELVVA